MAVRADADRVTDIYQRNLEVLGARVMHAVLGILGHVNTGDLDRWWRTAGPQVEAQVRNGWLSARDLAAQYVANHAKAAGAGVVRPTPATWNPKAARGSLYVTGPVAWKTARGNGATEAEASRIMQTRLLGAAQRIATNGGRGTVYRTAQKSPVIVGWRRIHKGPKEPCYFCALLLSRGAVYKSAITAGDKEAGGELYHDSDQCSAEPLYEGEEEPEHVKDLYDQWLKVTGKVPTQDRVKVWRRYWENRNKAE